MFRRKHMLFCLLILAAAGCGGGGEAARYITLAPTSPIYGQLHVEAMPGNAGITAAFSARDGSVLSIAMTARDGALYLAQDLSEVGAFEGDPVEAETLRGALIANGIVSAGQFKNSEAVKAIGLILGVAFPDPGGLAVPASFEVIESSLDVRK